MERYWYDLIHGKNNLFNKKKDGKLNTKLGINQGCLFTQYIIKFVAMVHIHDKFCVFLPNGWFVHA